MTAPTAVVYNSTTANGGIMLAECITQAKELAAKVKRVRDMALEITAGDTPANLEAVGSGFEAASGQGDDLDLYLGSISTHLNDATFQGYLSKLDRGG
jgi:hypothetical protein